jgi:hypothetical protein
MHDITSYFDLDPPAQTMPQLRVYIDSYRLLVLPFAVATNETWVASQVLSNYCFNIDIANLEELYNAGEFLTCLNPEDHRLWIDGQAVPRDLELLAFQQDFKKVVFRYPLFLLS